MTRFDRRHPAITLRNVAASVRSAASFEGSVTFECSITFEDPSRGKASAGPTTAVTPRYSFSQG